MSSSINFCNAFGDTIGRRSIIMMSREQAARMAKLETEPFFLLPNATDGSGDGSESTRSSDPVGDRRSISFRISGSKRDIYTVAISPNGFVTCTCMDARMNCRRSGCVCKHACFLLRRALRMPADDPFFSATARGEGSGVARLHEARISAARDLHEGAASVPPEALTPHSLHSPQPSHAPSKGWPVQQEAFCTRVRQASSSSAADDCPVCFTELAEGTHLRFCPDCGNGIHLECASRWMRALGKRAKTCVMCRSHVWTAWNLQ